MKYAQATLQVVFIFLLLVVMGTPLSAQSTLNGGWKLHKKKDKNNLRVYTRPNSSGLKELRIITEMDCSIESLIMVLNDVSSFNDWVYKSANAKLVKRVSSTESYYYSESELPFPVSNRDLVAHSKQWEDAQGIIHARTIPAKKQLIPKKKGIVRITNFESRWRITPKGKNKVHIDYQAKVDPGGSIPTWLANMTMATGPIKTMEGLSEMVQKPKYKNAPRIKYKKYPAPSTSSISKD